MSQRDRLPPFYAITAPLAAGDSAGSLLEQPHCQDWLSRFERLLESGVELVQLRVKELPPDDLNTLAEHCQGLALEHDVRLLLNGPAELAHGLKMSGIHLTSAALMNSEIRPLGPEFLVGASCHSPEELARAEAIGADLACLSPVRPTKGYDDEDILGFEVFADWVADCTIPVYGLGGLCRGDLDAVRRAGGQGVAGISAFW